MKIIFLITILISSICLHSQVLHAAYLEVGGIGGLYSVNYDMRVPRILGKKIDFSFSPGFTTNQYTEKYYHLTIDGKYLILRGVFLYHLSPVSIEAGVNYLGGFEKGNSLTDQTPDSRKGFFDYWFPALGVRYQKKEDFFVRATVLPVFYSAQSENAEYLWHIRSKLFFPNYKTKLFPWFGAAVGWSF